MKAELKAKWLAALRGGEYKQTTGVLYDPGCNGYCCLGVLAHVSGVGNDALEHWGTLSAIERLDLLISKDWWLGTLEMKLVNLNDDLEWSFPMIADWIETNVEPADPVAE